MGNKEKAHKLFAMGLTCTIIDAVLSCQPQAKAAWITLQTQLITIL